MSRTQAPYGRVGADPLPQHGLEADSASTEQEGGLSDAQAGPGEREHHPLADLHLGIDRITIGERHRKSFGRIEELAESIAQLGLLQPIGVDPDHRLIFGARRIAAFEHLGRKTIPARVIAIDDLLDGEYAENLIRKEFTVSERVAIGKSMAARLGERRGGDRKSEEFQTANNCGLIEEKRDLAAEHAGFGNHETYRQAEKVCDQGVPELIELMDEERISISAAARLIIFPEEVQQRAVKRIATTSVKPTEALRQIRREDLPDRIAAWPDGKHRVPGTLEGVGERDDGEPRRRPMSDPRPQHGHHPADAWQTIIARYLSRRCDVGPLSIRAVLQRCEHDAATRARYLRLAREAMP